MQQVKSHKNLHEAKKPRTNAMKNGMPKFFCGRYVIEFAIFRTNYHEARGKIVAIIAAIMSVTPEIVLLFHSQKVW